MSITITATANQPVTSDINTPRTSKEIPFIDGVMTFLFLIYTGDFNTEACVNIIASNQQIS